ncbi:DMT family transporter [Clostridium sp. CF012]|uniref:DMT family transporter n=1 Tax=Clostridium sp. CF012 TaxID=2843319 RepID=UPI001C0DB546|nr:DMT family transporter [Clostridium sp. CF012]MBU3143262.1 DMT family transporter [Clostridium sp. CF012]
MSKKSRGIILVVIASILWGIMGVSSRELSMAGYSSYDISFLRCLLAGSIYYLYLYITNRNLLRIDLKGLIVCFIYGSVAFTVSFLSYSISVERIPVAVATVLMFMSPIWVSILGAIVFKEKITLKNVITIGICLLGCILTAGLLSTTGGDLDPIGVIAGIINGIGVALQIMIPRYFKDKYDAGTMLVYGFLGGIISLGFITNFEIIFTTVTGDKSTSVILHILILGIVCTMIANTAYIKSSEYIGTSMTSILSSLQTVVGALVGYLIFREIMTVFQIIGALIIIVGSLGTEIYKILIKIIKK